MAAETTTTTADDAYFTRWLDQRLFQEVRPMNVIRPFMFYSGRQTALILDVGIQNDPGPGVATTGEGTGFGNVALSTSKASITASTVGLMATVTDELKAISIWDAYNQFGNVLERSVSEKYEVDMTATMTWTTSSGVTNTALTMLTFLAAHAVLQARDVHGQEVAVVHPNQANDLKKDVAITSTGSYWANPQAKINGLDVASLAGYQGAPFGIPIFQTTAVPTANAAVDSKGGLFIANEALGLYEIWGTRSEMQRDASMPGSEIVVTAMYGAAKLRDTFGQGLISVR